MAARRFAAVVTTPRLRSSMASGERHIPAEGGFALRRWQTGDADVVLDAFTDPELAWQAGDRIETSEDAGRWIAGWTHKQVGGVAYALAVLDSGGRVVGNVVLDTIDRGHGTARVTYWTVRDARGRGAATHGVRALTRWAFGSFDLFRLELSHLAENADSCAVAGRAGFLVEGLQRAKLRHGDRRYDVEMHARLRTDPLPDLG